MTFSVKNEKEIFWICAVSNYKRASADNLKHEIWAKTKKMVSPDKIVVMNFREETLSVGYEKELFG